MGNAPSERNEGSLGAGGPQDGPIGGRDSDRQIQGKTEAGETGGVGDGDLGQGGQRHSGGSSRDSRQSD